MCENGKILAALQSVQEVEAPYPVGMPDRAASLTRLGIGSELVPRLESVDWLVGGEVLPEFLPMVVSVRAGPEPESTLHRLANLAERRPDLTPARLAELAPLAGCSPGLWEALLRHPEWLEGDSSATESAAGKAHRAMIDIALADLTEQASLEKTTGELSDLADRLAGWALTMAKNEVAAKRPEAADLAFSIVAMGKWGGRELNYASDIDLLFVYESGALPPERCAVFANGVATTFIEILSKPGPEGFAFRVDADLRPEGKTGPLARSLDSYRAYYERWGEAWEMQALLKARPVTGDPELGARFLAMIERFVWPEALNPETIRSLRHLKARAEIEAGASDLKRGPGGIRDVEFSVQLLQLIHGRHDPHLRATGTLATLGALAEGGYVHTEDADALADSYRWLRTAEHRLQLRNLEQTHTIPKDAMARDWLAKSMGYRDGAETTASATFEAALQRHRGSVRKLHERLYYRPLLEAFGAAYPGRLRMAEATERLQAIGFADQEAATRALAELRAGFSRKVRLMDQMLPLMLEWLADSPNPDLGLEQLRLLILGGGDHPELIGILREQPIAGQRLCRLLGTSRLIGRFMDRLPEFLPRLADERALTDLPGGTELTANTLRRMEMASSRPDRLGALRRFVRRRMLRIAARDLLDLADLASTTVALTDTADSAAAAGMWVAERNTGALPFTVVAMGKWGGRELGYGSDLDLIYVYRAADSTGASRLAAEFAAALGESTQDGVAYQVDPGLRPEGKQGPLARSLDAYRLYYERWAEPWEFLALTRARAVAGDAELGADFIEMSGRFLYPESLPPLVIRAIRHIKARVESERIPPGEDPDFHLKLGPGGLSDIEFLTQLLQLRFGHGHPELAVPNTAAALEALGRLEVITIEEEQVLRQAHEFCTVVRNRLFLQIGRPTDALPSDPDELSRLAVSLGYPNRSALREEYRKVTRRARRIFVNRFYED
jgi:glutamate-ammonia-ligase adenylyltransferase